MSNSRCMVTCFKLMHIFNNKLFLKLEIEARVQQLEDFTKASDDLGSTEVIVSVVVLLTATEEVSGNLSVS